MLIEPDHKPHADGQPLLGSCAEEIRDWYEFWDTFRLCLNSLEVDVAVPGRLLDMVAATGAYENIVKREGNIPVGFWPTGE